MEKWPVWNAPLSALIVQLFAHSDLTADLQELQVHELQCVPWITDAGVSASHLESESLLQF